jgi:uracil-DNA glycosylase
MTTLLDLWKQSTDGTVWEEVGINRELVNIDKLALKPRIPDDQLIFRVFRVFPHPELQIKLVLLGQDPYPEILKNPEVSRACGFSFSSPLGGLPLSLRTMFGEILREFPQEATAKAGSKVPKPVIPSDYSGDLSYLIGEGVFLLNAYLTIENEGGRGKPDSHKSWVCFTTQILNFIRRMCPKAVYLALGKKASDLLKASGVTDAIECDHPANRFGGRHPFKGSDIFLQANELLKKRGIEPVDWIPMKNAVDTEYYIPTEIPRRAPRATKIVLPEEPVAIQDRKIDEISEGEEDEDP